jgi:beta-lactamase class A
VEAVVPRSRVAEGPLNFFPRRKLFASPARRHRRQRFGALAVLLILAAGAMYVFGYASGGVLGGEEGASGPSGDDPASREDALTGAQVGAKEAPSRESEFPPEPPGSPEEAAYVSVAPELPGISPESIQAVYRSKINPSWASVHLVPSGERKVFVVFAQRSGDSWEAKKSIRLDEPDYPQNDLVALGGIPQDLLDYLYPENLFAVGVPEPAEEEVDRGDLPNVGPAEFPPPEPVIEDVPDSARERVEKALEETREEIEGYEGVTGVYVRDVKGGWGYGVRPDETFFSASVIKVPVMVAVYRKVDEGELSFSQMVEIQADDWASGAGWLQWEQPGTKQTVGDLLYLMMGQSDNVATNTLVRLVGGRDHVNEVARSLGAKNTMLYQKVSSERAVVPSLDNRTTPRDMATMMGKISTGEAASDASCKDMIALMYQNELDWWLDAGLPANVWAANKAGWLYEVFNEAGFVEDGDHPYVVAILSKYGPQNPDQGRLLIEKISRTVWEAQQDNPAENLSGENGSDEGDS